LLLNEFKDFAPLFTKDHQVPASALESLEKNKLFLRFRVVSVCANFLFRPKEGNLPISYVVCGPTHPLNALLYHFQVAAPDNLSNMIVYSLCVTQAPSSTAKRVPRPPNFLVAFCSLCRRLRSQDLFSKAWNHLGPICRGLNPALADWVIRFPCVYYCYFCFCSYLEELQS
jgi:hypothetical protein